MNAGVRYDRFEGSSNTIRQETEKVTDMAAYQAERNRRFQALINGQTTCFLTPDPAACLQRLLDDLNNLDINDFTVTTVENSTELNQTDASHFSPNFGVTVEPVNGLQLFARYAEGFRALSMVELGQSFSFNTGFDPDLEPEVLKTWEYGLNYVEDGLFFDDDIFRFKLVYFNNEHENFIARPFLGAPFTNFDQVSTSGIETTMSYDMGRVFADVNFSYYTEIPSNLGNTVSSLVQPRYSGSITAGTRWFNKRLELGARVTFFDERQPSLGDELSLADVSRYWQDNIITDIFGSYRLNDYLSADFSVSNITDEYYLPPLFVNRMPSPGRTFRVGLTAAASF